MKIKIKNPVLVWLAKNIWIAFYSVMFLWFVEDKFTFIPTWVLTVFNVLIVSQFILFILYNNSMTKSEQKNEERKDSDERAQMILGKASKLSSAITMCVCIVFTFTAVRIFNNYTIGLTVLCVAFFNQLLLEILKAVFSRKY